MEVRYFQMNDKKYAGIIIGPPNPRYRALSLAFVVATIVILGLYVYHMSVVVYFVPTYGHYAKTFYHQDVQTIEVLSDDTACAFKDNDKIDCYPGSGANQTSCEARRCCWVPKHHLNIKGDILDVPYCFYPAEYGGYSMGNVTSDKSGRKEVVLTRTFPSPYPDDVKQLKIRVIPRTRTCVQIQITSVANDRYSPMYPEIPILNAGNMYEGPVDYEVVLNKSQLGFKVMRINSTAIFDAQDVGGFIFADQFLQLSARLPAGVSLYGLGEHQTNLRLSTRWQKLTLFNADQVPTENANLYGSQPFMLAHEKSAGSFGVYLLNSNAMDIVLQPSPIITYRTIGGILDFFFMTGPTSHDVVRQYTELVGRPHLPPLWSLGFHLCRYGTKTLADTKKILSRNQAAGIPIDVQWNDLDYMSNNNDFTFDQIRFAGLPQFVKNLQKAGVKWVPLIDPGISASEPAGTYVPFDNGVQMDVFVKNASGGLFIGKVWNRGTTVWPDFTHVAIRTYWTQTLKYFHDVVPFDGAWVDMNEPSNFYSGSATGCPASNLESPPYVPQINGGVLNYKTFCMTAKHMAGDHYDVHNIYGLSEVVQTYYALSQIRNGKRPFIITRSTFSGLGKFAGHWSGDVSSTWYDMKRTISDMLSFSIFGIPLMGSDICGFNGNTTVELCARWYQLGAFYPFSRTHNTDDAIPQDPTALGDVVLIAARRSLLIRYSLLPYLYTLFYHAHREGATVARPLFFEFANDSNTFGIDEQFLWGRGLMIVPVLNEGAVKVSAYLPSGRWYDFYTGVATGRTGNITLDAPIDIVPLLVRGGTIIPMQIPNSTTVLTRLNPLELLIALDHTGTASGDIYFDDGEMLGTVENDQFTYISLSVQANKLSVNFAINNYKAIPHLRKLTVMGVFKAVIKVLVNNEVTLFKYNNKNKLLTVENLKEDLNGIQISWL